MKVKVEQKHIGDGNQVDSETCPVALALTDMLYSMKGFHSLCVTSEYIELWLYNQVKDKDDLVLILLDDKTAERIRYFDRKGKMDPFEFNISAEYFV